jgi:hypothetical protein
MRCGTPQTSSDSRRYRLFSGSGRGKAALHGSDRVGLATCRAVGLAKAETRQRSMVAPQIRLILTDRLSRFCGS